MRSTSFFGTLGALATRQEENQLSRTFKACFDNSPAFQQLIINFISTRLGRSLGKSSRWVCNVEEAVQGRVGRLDLRIRTHDGAKGIAIESKVESPLQEAQIAKYQKSGVKNLLIVTKHPPEVSERRLRQLGVVSFRWQDVHDLLRTRRPRSPVDRFLCDRFADYLEEASMAYPKDITVKDLNYMASAFRAVRADSPLGRTPRSGFDAASRCLDMLGAIAKRLRDECPGVEQASEWGPAYFNWEDESDDFNHFLTLAFYRKPWKRSRIFFLKLSIPQKAGDLWWGVEYYKDKDSDETDFYDWQKLKKVAIRKGLLDSDALFRHALKAAKKWKVRL